MSSPKAKGRYLPPQKMVSFYELCDGLRTDSRTWRPLLPFFHFPGCFKGVFACALPYLGLDPVMPERLWGGQGTVDTTKVWRPDSLAPPSAPLPPLPLSQVYADLDLAAQGFTALPISTSIVDMDLTWQKYGLNFCSPSLGRAMSR